MLKGWACSLIHRSSTGVSLGQPLTGWILNVDVARHHVEVSDSNFGFLPISDRMRPRYVTSLRRIAFLLEDPNNASETDADAISEVKGMFSRCARRDQWDWRAVHMALDEPLRGEARKLATILGEVSAALRCGDMKTARAGIEDVVAGGDLARKLLKASAAINASVAAIPKSRALRSRGVGPKKSAGKPISVVSTYAKEKLDTANATHATLIDVLGQFLRFHGHRVEANQFIDAFARLKSGPALFEAKSITDDNELAQIRHGLSQLYEYRYRHGLNGATLWLVLSRIPKEIGWSAIWRKTGGCTWFG